MGVNPGTTTFQGRIERLSPAQRELLARRLQRELRDPSRRGESLDGRLAAYYVAGSETDVPAPAELRRFVAERLPAYLVPSRFVQLRTLPLLPNGKIDRRALAERHEDQSPPTPAPGSAAGTGRADAARLLEIWREMLGNANLGEDDDFFEAGGDSILAIQLISRAAREGLRVSLGEFFRAPTASQMAAVARTHASTVTAFPAAAAVVSNDGRPVPLTPIQHWFLEQDFAEPHQWNQQLALEVPAETDHGLLEAAIRAVILHHEAFRLALVRKGAGWQQHVKALCEPLSMPRVDLSDFAELERVTAIEREIGRQHASLRLDGGLLLRAVRFSDRSGSVVSSGRSGILTPATDRLYLMAHHLAVDPVTWRILLDDLETGYRQLEHGAAVSLQSGTTPFSDWSDALHRYAQTDAVRKELRWWTAQGYDAVRPLPRDFPDGGANDEASADVLMAGSDALETARLIDHAVPTHRADVPELILAAVIQTLTAWAGNSTLLVGLEGHGRNAPLEGVDVSRTGGWFTCYFPVVFDAGASADTIDVLRRTKEQLRAVPGKGTNYGLLRYLTADADVTQTLAAKPTPEVIFNYLGHERAPAVAGARFRVLPEGFGQVRSPAARRPSVFEINARIVSGRLEIACGYSRNLHRRATVEGLMRRVTECLRSVAGPDALSRHAALTPSDFPDAGLDQSDLDSLVDRIP